MTYLILWIKEWAIPLSAGATFLLALAAFWAIRQTYSFRKRDRKRLIKERALTIVRNWANDACELISLNAKYADEHQRPEFNHGKQTLEEIQVAKSKLITQLEETLVSARLWPDLFNLTHEAYEILQECIEKGMADDPNLTVKYREHYTTKFVQILPLTRQIEEKDPDFII